MVLFLFSLISQTWWHGCDCDLSADVLKIVPSAHHSHPLVSKMPSSKDKITISTSTQYVHIPTNTNSQMCWSCCQLIPSARPTLSMKAFFFPWRFKKSKSTSRWNISIIRILNRCIGSVIYGQGCPVRWKLFCGGHYTDGTKISMWFERDYRTWPLWP